MLMNPSSIILKNMNTIVKPNLIMLSRADCYLTSSILLETVSTCFLKNTINNRLWFIPVYSGYAISFYTFPKSFTKYSLSSAYSIWCGGGIILTTIIDKLVYKEIITMKKILSAIIVIIGITISK